MAQTSAFAGTALAVDEDRRDLDVEGVTVVTYVRHEHDFIVTLEGGLGQWVDEHDQSPHHVDVHSVTVTFGYRGSVDLLGPLADAIGRILDYWCQEKTPLRLVAAPGMSSILVESPDRFLLIPRTP